MKSIIILTLIVFASANYGYDDTFSKSYTDFIDKVLTSVNVTENRTNLIKCLKNDSESSWIGGSKSLNDYHLNNSKEVIGAYRIVSTLVIQITQNIVKCSRQPVILKRINQKIEKIIKNDKKFKKKVLENLQKVVTVLKEYIAAFKANDGAKCGEITGKSLIWFYLDKPKSAYDY